MSFTSHQKRYFAEQLILSRPSNQTEALASSMSGVKVDLNPHQVDAALFALKSPISQGSLLADEVGLGKTIEAGLVIAQYWAQRRRNLLLILPAALRIQWKSELEEKFSIPCIIVERPKNKKEETQMLNPFSQAVQASKIVICSYEYAANNQDAIHSIPWDLVIIDEAHRLRNIYRKKSSKRALAIKQALKGRKKLLLTATPLQNSLKELFGLVCIIDENLFGDCSAFTKKQIPQIKGRLLSICKRTLRKDVTDSGYIKFTKRQVITRPYTPGTDEQHLYDVISEYLQMPHLFALPENGRNLVTIVIRKLLASSTAAISNTLQTLIDRLKSLVNDSEDNLDKDFSEDFDAYCEYQEEYQEEDEYEVTPSLRQDDNSLGRELALLERVKKIADSIDRDSKGTELLTALQVGFIQAQKNISEKEGCKGTQKAVIFTESVKTQNYLLKLLNQNGYKGKIVLLNGENKDEISQRIYYQWVLRHKDDGLVSGSKNADMKAAIVEEFRDRAAILIGTEAAAEGINLQFCNLLVNYDLPWNPQRVEQRIGRCHRYGQKYDVVVVNFVNQNNAADKRVYDLLDKKFKLFDGVFGSSDEILGAVESEIDFERTIYKILQRCRSKEEINQAFDDLCIKFDDIIKARKEETLQQVLETFDEDVTARLKDCENVTRKCLSKFERWRYDLFMAFGAEKSTENSWSFIYEGKRYSPSWENSKAGEGAFLTLDSSVYTQLLKESKALPTPIVKIQYKHSSLPEKDQICFFKEHPRLSGSISIDKLIYQYGIETEKEERLLIACVTNEGEVLDVDMINRLMEIPAQIISEEEEDSRLKEKRENLYTESIQEINTTNKNTLVQRFNELNQWHEESKNALEQELDNLRNSKQLLQGKMKSNVSALTMEEIIDLQKEISNINAKIDKYQREMLHNKDKINEKVLQQQKIVVQHLTGTGSIEPIMTFSFEIA